MWRHAGWKMKIMTLQEHFWTLSERALNAEIWVPNYLKILKISSKA